MDYASRLDGASWLGLRVSAIDTGHGHDALDWRCDVTKFSAVVAVLGD